MVIWFKYDDVKYLIFDVKRIIITFFFLIEKFEIKYKEESPNHPSFYQRLLISVFVILEFSLTCFLHDLEIRLYMQFYDLLSPHFNIIR